MSFSLFDELNENKKNQKRNFKSKHVETLENYLNIWNINPNYKDINSGFLNAKFLSLLALITFFIVGTYLICFNFIISLIIGLFTFTFFIVSFESNMLNFNKLDNHSNGKLKRLDPFKDLIFFFSEENANIIFFTNKKDMITVGISIFNVKIIPENIHPSLNQFIKSLNELQVPFSYQIFQTPLDISPKNYQEDLKHHQKTDLINSYNTSVHFCTFYDVRGILSNKKLLGLTEKLTEYIEIMRSNFSANFPHFNLKLLSGNELISALRAVVTKNNSVNVSENNNEFMIKRIKFHEIVKLLFCIFILIYSMYLTLSLNFLFIFTVLLGLILVANIFWIWWREPLSNLSLSNIKTNNNLIIVNPFKDINFYRIKGLSESLFLHVNSLLINLKMVNLKYATPVYHSKLPICYPGKFYRALIREKITFGYNIITAPMSFYSFDKECYKFLNEKSKRALTYSSRNSKSDLEGKNWLDMRAGIWRLIMTISIFNYKYTEILNLEEILSMEQELNQKLKLLINSFTMNYHRFELVPLKNKVLISGFLCETLKNKFIYLSGTHLKYIMFQGKALIYLIQIADEFKKGVESKIAAEFNTPLQLENFITFGDTINTEFLEQEVPAGFLEDQIHNLLIVNGKAKNREDLAMKLVIELIKAQLPSLIFDFSGQWSKIIKYFLDTRQAPDFLHFKLGRVFNIDPIRSDISYDTNNTDYLDYIFDSYAMVFKKDEKTMDLFKNTILRNPDLDIASLNLELKNQQSWEKTPISDTIIALFDEFTQGDFRFFNTNLTEHEYNITFKDFISDDRTVILDLSIINDYRKQIFITFIILSKIIHYIRNFDDFYKKLIVIPRIDIIFETIYLEKTMNYGRIDKFLDPLRREGFGLICLANQIHYLHPNVFNYFQNIVSFRANYGGDIKVLKNIMNLQELHGTGYYTSSRNNTYQIDYLMNMKENDVLIKRSDLYQPFPAIIDDGMIQELNPMSHNEIIAYMKGQGYDLQLSEKKILEQTKKTIFEKDLGKYAIFLEEIINFLRNLKAVDKIGNLYKSKIKEELMKFVYSKGIKITNDKRKLKQLRDELFEILIKFEYLVEDHPKTAGGSEAIRASYSVGNKYENALNDYYQIKKNSLTDVSINVIEKNSDKNVEVKGLFKEIPNISENELNNFKEILAKKISDLYFDLFQIHKFINKNEFELALKIEKDFVKKFLINLYKEFYQVNYIITEKDLERFSEFLSKNKYFPYSKTQILNILSQCNLLDVEHENMYLQVKENYKLLSEFFNQIQLKISES
ncbi:MAG: hypothetical protein ACFFDK_10085 [Promethearchaeota archaeon]